MGAEPQACAGAAAEGSSEGGVNVQWPGTPWQEDMRPEEAGWRETVGWTDQHPLDQPLLDDVPDEDVLPECVLRASAAHVDDRAEGVLLESGEILPEGGEILPEGGEILPGSGGLPESGDLLPGAGDILPDSGEALPEAGDIVPEGAACGGAEAGLEAADTCTGSSDSWTSVVVFGDRPDSPLFGSVGLPATEGLSADEALAVAECAERVIGWATGVRLRALARLEPALAAEDIPRRGSQPVRFGGAEAHALAVAEAATSSAISEMAAARLLHDAVDLTGSQSDVLEAVQTGAISFQHARVILDQARTLPPEVAQEFGREALERAVTRSGRRRTPSELRSALKRVRERMHPESIQSRKKAAARERGVWFAPEPDGMCTLTAFLPAEAGLAVLNGLDTDARTALAEARRSAGQESDQRSPETSAAAAAAGERTLSQLRADALIHRLLGSPDPAFVGPFRPEVVVTIPLDLALVSEISSPAPAMGTVDAVVETEDELAREQPALAPAIAGSARVAGLPSAAGSPSVAGSLNASGSPSAGVPPTAARSPGEASRRAVAELEGYGPIDAPTARRLASLAPNWDRLFTDPITGAALGVGRTAYRPPKALRRYLAHRDGGCLFPGCTRRAKVCEPDHIIEWQDGGKTDPDNLALLCRKHHALKSIGAWSYQHLAPDRGVEHGNRTGHDDRAEQGGGAGGPARVEDGDRLRHGNPAEAAHLLRWRSPLGRTHISETALPEIAPPEPPAPEIGLPECAVPGSAAPGSAAPGSAVPESAVPGSAVPERGVPDRGAPIPRTLSEAPNQPPPF
ncbi:DUF222 domain-containing protein [Sinomonas terrae]|uniref:DUF222 domain-containing protein n=1 Tax=Sinomonas terrae TaxID=2908838 RepID=A0ABS9U4M6_9MICC|nr:DUF222 domain-containing protein [Sinomonas terrae]MCH6471467.1 DUF222 domain-containing protein [Sinomonas terrae]